MWFIKAEFWNEFQDLIKDRQYEDELRESISKIITIENFCKQGKGVSFYNRRTLNNKLINEIQKYKNDKDYHEYSIKSL